MVASAISDFRAWYLQQFAKRPVWYATQQVKQAAWEMLGAIEELRAKPIWSAAQRAQLAALSERLRTATVAGETEQLRELLPRASGEVNALILAAQAAAQRRAAAARYVPAPNAGTGGMDLGWSADPDSAMLTTLRSTRYASERTSSPLRVRRLVDRLKEMFMEARLNVSGSIAGYVAQNYGDNFSFARDWYKKTIHDAFGITIEQNVPDESVPLNYEALRNYHLGAEGFARMLQDVCRDAGDTCARISAAVDNRYALFQQTMGPLTINRTDKRPENSGNAWGYTQGHTINDIFDNGRTTPMTAANFAHELGHSLSTSGGLGAWKQSPPIYDGRDGLYLGSFAEAMDNALDAQKCNRENKIGETPTADGGKVGWSGFTNETLANFLQGMAGFGLPEDVTPQDLLDDVKRTQGEDETKQRFAHLIANAILYHTPPQVVTEELRIPYTSANGYVLSSVGVTTRYTVDETGAVDLGDKIHTGIDLRTFFGLKYNAEVTLLARTAAPLNDTGNGNEFWVYVHVQNGAFHQYGWIRADLLRANGESGPLSLSSVLDTLPIIPSDITTTFVHPAMAFEFTWPKRSGR